VYIGCDFEGKRVPLSQKYLCIFTQAWNLIAKLIHIRHKSFKLNISQYQQWAVKDVLFNNDTH
jgi:hypothetical protein